MWPSFSRAHAMLDETVIFGVMESELEENRSLTDPGDSGIVFFVIDVCLVGPCAVVGIAGNITCLFVLRVCQRFRSTMYLLRALALANTLLLLTNFFVRTLVQIGQNTDFLGDYTSWFSDTMWFWHPVPDVFHMAAVYYILLVAIDRYLLVYYPVLGERLCKPALVICYIVAVMVIAILCFIPKFFDLGGFAFPLNTTNATFEMLRTQAALATLDQPTAPKIAYDAFDCFIQSILPTFCTAFFNLLLIKALRKVISNKEGIEVEDASHENEIAMKRGPVPTPRTPSRHGRQHTYQTRSQKKLQSRLKRIREDRSIMVMLVLVVSVAIICELPMTVASFMKIITQQGATLQAGAQESYYILVQIAMFFENFNACVNFFLYCVSYASFRRTLKSCLCNCVCY